MQMTRQGMTRAVSAIALAAGGALVGANLSTTNLAKGEVRGTPEPPAFQAGDQLALPILREISGTLHQMDGRLARLESAAQKLQVTHAHTAVPSPAADDTEAAQ
jgi:hypothetical protein